MWYPYRMLQQAGVSGELATLLSYTIALVIGLMVNLTNFEGEKAPTI